MEFRKGLDGKKFFRRFIILIVITILAVMKYKEFRLNKIITDVSDLVRDPNSVDYVNDLYISDGRHAKYLLNDKEREDYNKIYAAIKEHKNSVTLTLDKNEYSNELIVKMVEVIGMDHPELIYFSYLGYRKVGRDVEVSISYSMDENQYQQNLQNMQYIINNIKEETNNMNEYEKCKYVYEWLGKNNIYGDTKGTLAHSAYSAFPGEGFPVCEGFAKATQIIMQNIGINSILVVGRRNNGELHDWNMVKIEGKYYYFDATSSVALKNILSDPICYLGFLIEDVNQYKPSNYCKKLLPRVNGKKYRYHIYNDLEIKFSDTDECYKRIQEIADNKPENAVIEFRVKNISEFNKHKAEVEQYLGAKCYTFKGSKKLVFFK